MSRGIGGIDERTRWLTQRWFDMVDWRSAQVSSARSGVSRSIEGYARKLEGEVREFFEWTFVWGDVDPHGGGLGTGEPDGSAVVVKIRAPALLACLGTLENKII